MLGFLLSRWSYSDSMFGCVFIVCVSVFLAFWVPGLCWVFRVEFRDHFFVLQVALKLSELEDFFVTSFILCIPSYDLHFFTML